jgi:hypothetical protein
MSGHAIILRIGVGERRYDGLGLSAPLQGAQGIFVVDGPGGLDFRVPLAGRGSPGFIGNGFARIAAKCAIPMRLAPIQAGRP